MRKVLVIFGGVSPEHEVSRRSAAAVLEHIDREKNQVHTVGITKDGRWLYTTASPKDIAEGSWEKQPNRSALLSCDRAQRGLMILEQGKTMLIPLDVVMPMLHGENGEDGRLQGLLELADIPFVGPGMRASANGMDKATTKIVLASAGIRQADYLIFRNGTDMERMVSQVESKFVYPVFVKPSSTGSSCGVSKARNKTELITAINEAFRFDNKILVEEFIAGREIEVAVFGDRQGTYASVCGEIDPGADFYDYNAKYIDDTSTCHIPADLPEATAQGIRRTAIEAFETLECKGQSRVDFFALEDGSFVLNEINTLPGFTSISMYPKLMMYSQNLTYAQLIEKMLAGAED